MATLSPQHVLVESHIAADERDIHIHVHVIFFLFLDENMLWVIITNASHKLRYCGEIRKTLVLFSWKKVPYLELWETKENSYSRTSMARTPMARLPWLIRTRF